MTSLLNRKQNLLDYNVIRKKIWERDKWCVICGSQGHDVHHVVYRSRGGKDAENNLVLLCRDCHRAIHNGSPNSAMVKRGLYTIKQVYAYLTRYIKNRLWRLH